MADESRGGDSISVGRPPCVDQAFTPRNMSDTDSFTEVARRASRYEPDVKVLGGSVEKVSEGVKGGGDEALEERLVKNGKRRVLRRIVRCFSWRTSTKRLSRARV